VSKVWAICGAQYTSDGKAHLEIGLSQAASLTEVAEKLINIVTEANPAALVIDARSPAAVLIPLLIEAGVEPVTTNQPELAIACEGLLEAALARHISHSGQRILTDSVAAAAKKELPGGRFTWETSGFGGTITQLMAATLAHWGLLVHAKPPKHSAPPMAGEQETSLTGSTEVEFDAMSAAF
jgi:hypothetical protein